MSRDYRKLKVFALADELVIDLYRLTVQLPVEEKFGLQAQLRRAAVSVPTNIVEGCYRRTERDYLHFLNIALSSAAETQYLLGLAARLDYLSLEQTTALAGRYLEQTKALNRLSSALAGKCSEQEPEPYIP